MSPTRIQTSTTLGSSYLEYLPAIFQDDEFMGQFLLTFESILKPIDNTIENIPSYLNPLMTPEHLLHWLASWVDLNLDPTWPLEKRRQLVEAAAELHGWRGTKRGLSEHLRTYTGSVPEISESIPGMRLEQDTRLGINAQLGSSVAGHHFTVTLELDGKNEINESIVRAIIEAQKPAYAAYTLRIIGNQQKQEENGV